jgi:hypothetical protein
MVSAAAAISSARGAPYREQHHRGAGAAALPTAFAFFSQPAGEARSRLHF